MQPIHAHLPGTPMMRALKEDVFGVADGERRTVGTMGICPLLVTVKNEKRQGHTKPDAGANAHRGPGVNGEIGGEVERGLNGWCESTSFLVRRENETTKWISGQ